jgi:hypothetical protein
MPFKACKPQEPVMVAGFTSRQNLTGSYIKEASPEVEILIEESDYLLASSANRRELSSTPAATFTAL